MTETTVHTKPVEIDQAQEMREQTRLLKSINGKLGFFVFILVMGIILQFLGWLFS
jgi:hypothetical protein